MENQQERLQELMEEGGLLIPHNESSNGVPDRTGSPEDKEHQKSKKRTGDQPSRRISQLWMHFEDDGKRASCLYCDSKLVHHSSTTPLRNHLVAKHPERIPPGLSVIKPSRTVPKVAVGGLKDLDRLLVKALVRDLRPLSEADGALVHIISQVYSPWEVPKREVLRELLEQLFNEYQQKLHEVVTTECSGLSLSLESWTSSKDINQRFLSVYGHFLNKSFHPISVLLGVEGLKDFSAPTAATAVVEVLSQFGLIVKDHVSCLVAPESDSEDSQQINMSEVAASLEVPYEQCLTSFLKNVVHEILRPHETLLSTVRSLVSQIKCIHNLSHRFSNMQRDSGREPSSLFHDHPGRILSSYDMLARLTELRPILTDFMATVPELPQLSEQDWITCEQIAHYLQNFKDLSDELNSEKFVSAPISTVSVHGWQKLQLTPDPNPTIDSLRLNTIELFNRKIPPAMPFLISTFLDPRWKHLPAWNPEFIAIVHNEVENKSENLKVPVGTDTFVKLENNDDDAFLEPPPAKRRKKFAEAVQSITDQSAEIRAYVQENRPSSDSNPFEWWIENAAKFPKLALLARRYLMIPASATSSLTLSTRRAALGTSSVRKIVMLNRNMDVLDPLFPQPGTNTTGTSCGAMTTVSPDQGMTVVTHSHHDH